MCGYRMSGPPGACLWTPARCARTIHLRRPGGHFNGRRHYIPGSIPQRARAAAAHSKTVMPLPSVTVRFAGDSGDGMQLAGTQFTDVSALVGNDISTLPDFPAEIRAPAGTLAGVKRVTRSSLPRPTIFTPRRRGRHADRDESRPRSRPTCAASRPGGHRDRQRRRLHPPTTCARPATRRISHRR